MDNEISKRAKLIKDMVYQFNHNEAIKEHIVGETRGVSEINKAFKYPPYINVKRIALDNFEMELISRTITAYKTENKKDSSSSTENVNDNVSSTENANENISDTDNAADKLYEKNLHEKKPVILQLHGGGFVNAFKNNYRTMAGLYSEAGDGADVLTIDYRVAPENPYPAALNDALAAYDWLIENGYSEDRIIFAGDSAGGGLAMAMCHYLKDKQRKLPAGIVAMSPWTDLAATGSSYKEKCECDPVFGQVENSLIYDNSYVGENDVKCPYISALYGDFKDFPPMLIQAGSDEMLLSDSQAVAEKAKKAGVKVRFTIYEGMFHVFQMAAKLMPESMQAWSEVQGFLRTVLK